MKNKELIEKLLKFDMDKTVLMAGYDEDENDEVIFEIDDVVLSTDKQEICILSKD